jgi:hypothetical protein
VEIGSLGIYILSRKSDRTHHLSPEADVQNAVNQADFEVSLSIHSTVFRVILAICSNLFGLLALSTVN